MPIYNCEKYIRVAINSILAQKDVVAQILISDDCSQDDTFLIAYDTVISWVKEFGLNHSVLMRKGSKRLKRDHLHLVVHEASSDFICQAHGDDISHPLRCAILVKCFKNSSFNAAMIFVNSQSIDAKGFALSREEKLDTKLTIQLIPVSFNDAISEREILVGANMAWKKSSIDQFTSLSTEYSAYGHDRVMAFRACLIGGCFILDSQLLKKRTHEGNLHNELFTNNKLATDFNVQLTRFSYIAAIRKDVIFFRSKGLISDEKTHDLFRMLERQSIQYIEWAGYLISQLVSNNYKNIWSINH
jgi:glycosyltransferase involved in cell wall biosynthesis